MPKKRTKQQKIRAQYHYAFPVSRSFSGINQTDHDRDTVTAIKPSVKEDDVLSLYPYDPHYIRIDIRHTLLVSVLLLAIQLGLYFWLK